MKMPHHSRTTENAKRCRSDYNQTLNVSYLVNRTDTVLSFVTCSSTMVSVAFFKYMYLSYLSSKCEFKLRF